MQSFTRFKLGRVLVFTILVWSGFLNNPAIIAAELAPRGTIQSLQQDDGVIRISGRDFRYSDEYVIVTMEDREVGSQALLEGMIVRYTTNDQGYLQSIEILGPSHLIGVVTDN